MVTPLVERVRIDRGTATARTLLTTAEGLESLPTKGRRPELAIEDFEITLNRVSVDYRSDTEVYGRLAFTWFH